MKKKYLLLIGVVLIAGVGGILAYRLLGSLDRIVKSGVETFGPEITQADVRLDSVDVDLSTGKLALNGLVVGNPKGFETPEALKLDRISVTMDMRSLTKTPIVIDEIMIQAPAVTYELGGSGSNLDALSKNIDAYSGKNGKHDRDDQGPKLLIRNLYIKNGKINVSMKALKGKTLASPLPDVHMRDIGKSSGGATPGQVAKAVMGKITAGTGTAISKLDLGKLTGTASGALQTAGDAVKSGVEGVGGALKGLFGKD